MGLGESCLLEGSVICTLATTTTEGAIDAHAGSRPDTTAAVAYEVHAFDAIHDGATSADRSCRAQSWPPSRQRYRIGPFLCAVCSPSVVITRQREPQTFVRCDPVCRAKLCCSHAAAENVRTGAFHSGRSGTMTWRLAKAKTSQNATLRRLCSNVQDSAIPRACDLQR